VGDCQFDERDNAFIRDAINSVDGPYGEKVIIKKYTGVLDPGDPANGIQAQYQYVKIPTKVIVDAVTQRDILYSGGIYQVGDLRVTSPIKLNYIDTINQTGGPSQGDTLIYRGHEYRIVGKVDPETLVGNDALYIYVFRKIGNAV
jgi:hypothetical protein